MKKHINVRAAAQVLGVDKRIVFKLMNQGILPSIRYGDVFKLNTDDVERLREAGWVWNVPAKD